MKITSLRQTKSTNKRSYEDSNRDLFTVKFENVFLTGRNIHYPNCLIQTSQELINPYDERVMSLNKDSFYDDNEFTSEPIIEEAVYTKPVLFFIYNVDNYYHFIYDTLPILYTYFDLQKEYPDIEILLQTSHPTKQKLAPFVTEFFKAYKITNISFAKKNTHYLKMFVSTSFTHGGQSNDPPSQLSFSVWNKLQASQPTLPKRFYVSRRSWIHGRTENMGTNYTTRRKCMNEDALVTMLKQYGVEEVFTELLTTEEKIALFRQAELVVGIIGGGMCNLLFSPQETKSICIVTPHFLTINRRFQFSMNHTNIVYSNTGELFPFEGKFPLYSRVKIQSTGRIGEVLEYKDGMNKISVSSNDVAGFSQDFPMEDIWVSEEQLEAVDHGLNSPFQLNLESIESDLKALLNKE